MNKRPIGIKIFGIVNMIIGLTSLIIFSLPFLFGVIGGWVTYRNFYGSLDWFSRIILDRLILIILYIFSLLLFHSGFSMLKMKKNSRKLAIFSSSAIISSIFIWKLSAIINSIVYPNKENLNIQLPWKIIFFSFFLYTFLLIAYLMNSKIKRYFDDEDVKLPFVKIIIVILLLLLIPLIWSPNR